MATPGSAAAPEPDPAGAPIAPAGPVPRGDRVEVTRLAALHASGALVDRPQAALEALARAAAALCGTSVGLVNLLDEDNQIVAASVGFAEYGLGLVGPKSDSVCQYTIRTPAELTEVADLGADSRTETLSVTRAGLTFYAGANVLSASESALGVVCVLDRESRTLTATQRAGLRDLAAVASALIEQHGRTRQLVAIADRLGRESSTDPLTGLYNRRALEPVLANLPAHTAIAMIDLDHFKQLNDRDGHDAGDRALEGYAELFGSALREGDVAARWGGEEFLLVLDNVGDPRRVLERLRRRSRTVAPVTFSAGLTLAEQGEDPRELLARADRLLYRAKSSGRNRTVDDLI